LIWINDTQVATSPGIRKCRDHLPAGLIAGIKVRWFRSILGPCPRASPSRAALEAYVRNAAIDEPVARLIWINTPTSRLHQRWPRQHDATEGLKLVRPEALAKLGERHSRVHGIKAAAEQGRWN